jgi:hypothetical protein
MIWKPGDVAIIDGCRNDPSVNGTTVTVTSHEYLFKRDNGTEGPCVDISGATRPQAFTSILRKPYDGHEPCEWSDCIWQPSEVVA